MGVIMDIDPKTLDEMMKVVRRVHQGVVDFAYALANAVRPAMEKLREYGIVSQDYIEQERRKQKYLRRYRRRGERMRKCGHK